MTTPTATKDPLTLLKDHGGNPALLANALGLAEHYCLLDLSNAVSPFAYPLTELPIQRLAQLPYESTALTEVAASYYGVKPQQILAGAGSQQFIQCLPTLCERGKVLLPRLGYAEHARHWHAQGHDCEYYDNAQFDTLSAAIKKHRPDVLVLIHPNNPTGERVSERDILSWRAQLPAQGKIIVDEAFVDVEPGDSLSALLPLPGLIILRSAGKFFGLPGLRLGFLLADETTIDAIRSVLGPWPLSSLAQWAGEIMLADRDWQRAARARLLAQTERQHTCLQTSLAVLSESVTVTPFFTSMLMPHEAADWLCRALLHDQIAVRYYHQHADYACIRIGLAAANADLERLHLSLARLANIQEGLSNRAI